MSGLSKSKRKSKEQKPQPTSHPVPAPSKPDNEKLHAIATTLIKNLQNIPMTHWREPINLALSSAYIVGQAESVREAEDQALEVKNPEDPLDAGWAFIDEFARYFGSKEGVLPKDVSFHAVQVETEEGLNVMAVLPCFPLGFKEKL